MKVSIQKRFFSVKESAVYTGLSPRLIYKKLAERGLRSYRVGKKIVLDVRDIDAFVMANEVKSSDQLREILKEKMSGKRRKAGD
jgi:excisionase family DNA binding protein